MDFLVISRPSAVIFDLDGTLLDTEPLYTQAAQAVIDPYGKTFDVSLKRKIMGGDSRKSAAIVIEHLDLPIGVDEFLEKRESVLLRLFPSAPEIKGAGDFLTALAQTEMPLGLATSSRSHLCDIKLHDRAWKSCFRVIICGDDVRVKRLKPSPDIFLTCAQDLHVDPAACVAFEDSPNGIRAAIAAGMVVVGVDSPFVDRSDLSDASLVIQDFGEAQQLLLDWI
jgi:pseudouridine-5'-monophosphatase